jgi:MFS family permease
MSIQQQLSQSASLISAVDAVRNWRAAALLLISFVAAGLLFALAGIVTARIAWPVGAVFMILGFAAAFYGINAAGIMLMDEAQGAPSRPMLAAMMTSLATGHRLILVMLLVLAAYVVGILAMALVLFICKVPFLGPLMFAFVFPVFVVISGVAVFALYAVIAPLAAPSIWNGATTMQALSRLAAIARQRIVMVVLMMLVVFFITIVVGSVIGGMMMMGTLVTGGLSASIIGMGGMGMGAIAGMLGGMGGDLGGAEAGYGAAGHMMAAGFGGGIVWAVALTLPGLVYIRGCCQVYLANIQGINLHDAEQQMRGSLDAVKRRAEELKAKGEAMAAQMPQRFEKAAESAPAQASAPAPVAAPLAAAAAATTVSPAVAVPPAAPVGIEIVVHACPQCSAAVTPGDAFCGSCGHKL